MRSLGAWLVFAPALAWAGLCLAPARAEAQAPSCRAVCAEGEVYDEAAGCCVAAPELAAAERTARAHDAVAVAAARAELAAAAERARGSAAELDALYRTLFLGGTVSFLSNYVRMDHPSFLGDVARSSLFRLGALLEVSAPLVRRETDRKPQVAFEASVAAEAPLSYVGSFMFLPGVRGELRLRAFYFAPFVFSEVEWFAVRLDALTAGGGPEVRERGRAAAGGFGVSVGDHGREDGLGWLLGVRWGPLIDGGDAHVGGELRIFEKNQLYEIYFRGFDRLGEFTHGFSIGLAYGFAR